MDQSNRQPESHKNTLQEYCQINNLPKPIYETHRVGGTDHQPIWLSCVIIGKVSAVSGESSKKTSAEQAAAAKMIDMILAERSNTKNRLEDNLRQFEHVTHLTPVFDSVDRIQRKSPSPPLATGTNCVANLATVVANQTTSRTSTSTTSTTTSTSKISLFDKTAKKIVFQNAVLLVDYENLHNFVSELANYELYNLTVIAFIGNGHALRDRPIKFTKVVVPTLHRDGVDSAIQLKVGELIAKNAYEEYLIATRDHFAAACIDILINAYTVKARIVYSVSDLNPQ